MKIFQIAIFVFMLLCNALASASQLAGYGTGQGWKDTSFLLKEPWTQGFIDGLLVANYTSTPQGDTEWLTSCIRGMKIGQIVAVLDKYLADNPAEWHKPMSLSAITALKATCKK